MKLYRSNFYILFLIFFAFNFLEAQVSDYDIQFFSKENGLSNSVVRSVFQDSEGFMWVGTKVGLNRFDGHEFNVYLKRKNNLASNDIINIFEDRKGKIWVRFDSAPRDLIISIFDKYQEKAESFDESFPNSPFKEKDIFRLIDDENRNIWFLTKEGAMYKYDDGFELVLKKNEFVDIHDFKIIDEEIWIDDGRNLIQYSLVGDKINEFLLDTKRIFNYGKIGKERLWVDCINQNNTFQFFDLKSKTVTYQENKKAGPRNQSYFFENENKEQIWRFGRNVLNYSNLDGSELRDLSSEIKKTHKDFMIQGIFKDKFQNIWISSSGGLILLSPKNNLFDTFLVSNTELNSMRGIEELDTNHLFISSYVGFYLIDKKTGEATPIPTEKNLTGLGTLSIGDTILVGTHHNSFRIFNKKTHKVSYHTYPFSSNTNTIFFYQDKKNQIWVGTTNGLFHLDIKTLKVQRPRHIGKLAYSSVNHIFENEKGLWVSTERGLFLIDYAGEIVEEFEGLSTFQIKYLHQSDQDIFWLATKGSGLLKWNNKTNSIHQFTKDQGLSDDYIYAIIEDEFGLFWLPSYNGLMRFNSKDFSINTFYKQDGITHNEFNGNSQLKTKDGKIYLGTINGITVVDPKKFLEVSGRNSPLLISDFKKIKTGETEFQSYFKERKNDSPIIFETKDKAIEVDFSLLDYRNSFYSKFSYKIEGYDTKWNYLPSNRLIINRLPYGNYKLKVKAQGSKGSWSNQILEIPLIVIKPFYLTWQFITLSILALLGLIYGIIKWRIIRLEKRNLILENIVTERTKELADLNKTKDQFFAIIAHDMRGLVLSFKNISQKVGFLQRKGRQDEVNSFLQSVDKSAESLSNLLDNLLNWALVEKGVFPHHPELFNLEKVVLENVKLFTQMSRIKEIKLSYDIPETLNLYADENAVSTIIRNLINNAIKFSSTGDEVIIEATQKSGQIQIQIKDTGVGIASAKLKNIFDLDSKKTRQGTIGEKGTGLGLLLCKELVALNKGEIWIESQDGRGTNVLIEFPLVA